MSKVTTIIYAVLFLALILQPHLLPHFAFIPRAYVESLTSIVILGLAYSTYTIHRRESYRRTAQMKIYDSQITVLQHQAFHDPLTNLPNRLLLRDRVEAAIFRAERYKERIAVLYLDLDNFKQVNDQYGHKVGDLLLNEVSKRVAANVRETDTVARVGGDEFVILLTELSDENGAVAVAEALIQSTKQPLAIENVNVNFSISIGISLYPDDAVNIDELFKKADEALYKVKKEGKNRYLFYAKEEHSN